MQFTRGIVVLGLAFSSLVLPCLSQTVAQTVDDFDGPFLFAYGSWDKKVVVADGAAQLRGVTSAGGAGHNLQLDLRSYLKSLQGTTKVRGLSF